MGQANGLRYWRWGGHGLCLGPEKTRSQKNACRRCRRIPSVRCTLCWAVLKSVHAKVVSNLLGETGVALDIAPVSDYLADGRMSSDLHREPVWDYSTWWLGVNCGASEIEANTWLIANCPGVVSGRNNPYIAGSELCRGAIIHPNGHSP